MIEIECFSGQAKSRSRGGRLVDTNPVDRTFEPLAQITLALLLRRSVVILSLPGRLGLLVSSQTQLLASISRLR